MKNWIIDNAYGIYFTSIIFAMAGMASACFIYGLKTREREIITQVYPAWTKLHPENQLAYEEWRVLYRRGLLPR
jgi:hypothetical protein